jgi:PAS domain S-box-containing protein
MPKQNISILLIEDNPGDVGLLQEFLRESVEIDFQLITGATLKEGLELATKHSVDIILLDLSLPDSKGLKTLAKVRTACPGKPIIILTGNNDLSVSKKAIQDGAQDFLVKGKIDSDILIRAIMYAIQRCQLEAKIIKYSERLKKAQEVGHTGSWEIDLATKTVWASEEAYKIYGIIPIGHDLSLTDIKILPLPEFRAALDESLEQLISSDKTYDIEFQIRRDSDNQVRWIHSVAECVKGSFGKPGKVLGVIQDITESNQADEKLKTSEHLYKLITENARDVIWTMDLSGNFTYISPSVEKLRGYTVAEIMRQTMEEIVSPDGLASVKKMLHEHFLSIHNKEPHVHIPQEVEQPCKNGGSVWTEVVSSDLHDENGNIIGIIGVSRNISERKKMQDELRESEHRFWDMFNNAPFGYHELDKEGRIVQINQTELDMLQYKREEMLGSYAWNYLSDPESSQERILGKLRGQLPPGKGTERKYQLKNGTTITLLVEDRLIKDAAENITGLRSATQDITNRKKTENELIKLSMAVEQSPASIVITNINGEIEYVNHTFTLATGYDSSEVLHKNPRILKSGYTSKEEYTRLWNTILSGNTWRGEFVNVKKNGEHYQEEVIISPILDKRGEIINFLAIKRDVTELKKINEELFAAKETAEEMNRLKSSFLANMSHELRTPMIGILGYSEMLLEEFPDEKVHEISSIILQSAHRLMETLNLILDLSRIEAKKLEIKLTSVDIVSIAKDIFTLFSPAAERKNLSCKLDASFDALEILLDEKMLREILNNLVNNAIKFTERGDVTIKLTKEVFNSTEWAVVRVIDTGIGIAQEKFDLIFEEFRQASEGQSRSFEGTGLGLTITKRFVEKLNGLISVESTLGVGTTFTVRFPMQAAEPSEEPDVIIEEKRQTTAPPLLPQVLYVEDDEIAVHIVSKMLEQYCEIDTTDNAETALRMAEAKKYDAVFMDINLGKGMDGVKTTSLIKQMDVYKNTPIVALTAYAMVGDKEEFLNAGCTHYISKPFSKKELLTVMRDVLPTVKKYFHS